MGKIGLIYAMEAELESLLERSGAEKLETVAGVPFYAVAPGIVACAGGIGKVNIAMATQLLLTRHAPDLVLNAGVAGAMENLPVGTLVLAEQFVQHDMDTSAVGDPVGLVSTVNVTEFPCTGAALLARQLQQMQVPYQRGTVATGDWFATDCPRAHSICETFHPTLCEMEGCAVAQVCMRNGVAFAALKSVSDRLFSKAQQEEYFNFPEAMKKLNAVVLPLAQRLLEEMAS